MTVKYLTDIKEFLERNVAPKISLRGIADKDDTTCLMVSPHVTVGLPITFDTPACVRDKIPGDRSWTCGSNRVFAGDRTDPGGTGSGRLLPWHTG